MNSPPRAPGSFISDIDGPQAEKVRAEALERGAGRGRDWPSPTSPSPKAPTTPSARAVDDWGGVDVLVNNAGWSVPGFIATDTDRDKWQRTIEINLFSAIAATQAAIGPMKEGGGGSIVFIASDAAFGQIRQGVYGASKAAMVALARTTAREHGRHGIRSNVVCPGLVIPEGPEAVGAASLWAVGQDNVFNQNQIDYMIKDTPMRRLTTLRTSAAVGASGSPRRGGPPGDGPADLGQRRLHDAMRSHTDAPGMRFDPAGLGRCAPPVGSNR